MEQIIGSRLLYRGKKFEVREVEVELRPGVRVKWEIVDKGGNSVAMLPVSEHGEVFIVSEYFAATNERTLCVPKGMVEKGESELDAARRGLREELGLSGEFEKLVVMSVSPGYLTQRTTVFLVRNVVPAAAAERDEKHHLEPVKLTFPEAIQKIRHGQITEARTIGALMLANDILRENLNESIGGL